MKHESDELMMRKDDVITHRLGNVTPDGYKCCMSITRSQALQFSRENKHRNDHDTMNDVEMRHHLSHLV